MSGVLSWYSELAEQVTTTGDVGLPTSMIRKRFPQVRVQSSFLHASIAAEAIDADVLAFLQLQEALKGLPERWWYKDSANDVAEKRFSKSESKKELMVRSLFRSNWVMFDDRLVMLPLIMCDSRECSCFGKALSFSSGGDLS